MFVKHEARAIGSGSEGAQSALEEGYRRDMTLAEAEVLALATLKQVMEEKVGTLPLRPCPLRPLLHPSNSCPWENVHVYLHKAFRVHNEQFAFFTRMQIAMDASTRR